MRPDKAKVVDEAWDEARIAGFLHKGPMGDAENPDYSALLNAYRSMRPEDFAVFIRMFIATGRDLGATGSHGQTLLQTIQKHRRGAPFREILESARKDSASSP